MNIVAFIVVFLLLCFLWAGTTRGKIIVIGNALLFGFLLAGGSVRSIISAETGIGTVPLPIFVVVAAGLICMLGGCMYLKRSKYALIALWISFVLCIAAFALDPDGTVFAEYGHGRVNLDSLLMVALDLLFVVPFAHFDAYRYKRNNSVKQPEDSKAQEV